MILIHGKNNVNSLFLLKYLPIIFLWDHFKNIKDTTSSTTRNSEVVKKYKGDIGIVKSKLSFYCDLPTVGVLFFIKPLGIDLKLPLEYIFF